MQTITRKSILHMYGTTSLRSGGRGKELTLNMSGVCKTKVPQGSCNNPCGDSETSGISMNSGLISNRYRWVICRNTHMCLYIHLCIQLKYIHQISLLCQLREQKRYDIPISVSTCSTQILVF
jgi:hypothetical protein